MSLDEKMHNVEIPARIVNRVKNRLPRTEFDIPAEYITYVMEEVLYHVEDETDDDETELINEQEVKDRLESLGYLQE